MNILKNIIIIFILLNIASSRATGFDISLLAGNSAKSDLSRFDGEQVIPPGEQELDVYVNNNWKGKFTLIFGDNSKVMVKSQDVSKLGIKNLLESENLTYTLNELVQGGSYDIDIANLMVELTVPQKYLMSDDSEYISSAQWDSGQLAFLASYNSTYYKYKNRGSNSNYDFYTGIESGINLGLWQFRDSSSVRKYSGESFSWKNNKRFIKKAFANIQSKLLIGNYFSPGNLFESMRVRGFSLSTEENMRPASKQGFAPIIRGTARTNALVKIIQNNNVIFQENVPPGQFEFDNILPTGSGGDLLVVVKEASGEEQSFTVPFSAVPGMLKEGVSNYYLFAGEVSQKNTNYSPNFFQGTIERGINNLLTGYSGIIANDNYQSYLLGSGWNLPFGAVSVDIIHANSKFDNSRKKGQSIRVAYSKFIDNTSTNFSLAAYRYSTKGYYSFTDYINTRDGYRQYKKSHELSNNYQDYNEIDVNTLDLMNGFRPKNTFTINLNQRLSDRLGVIYISGSQRDFWNSENKTREYQIGYSNTFSDISYSISASRVRDGNGKSKNNFYISASLPFSIFGQNTWVNTGLYASDSKYQQSTIGISGTAMGSNKLSYSLSGVNQKGGRNTASADVTYRSRISTIGTSFSESNDYRQAGLSARGSMVAIPWDILASNEIGNTMMIVNAPKAQNFMVNSDSSILTNKNGLALVPYASAYRKNTVTLSNTDDSSGAQVINNIGNIVPYEGAVSIIDFKTDTRQQWLIKALDTNGNSLPFGTEVINEEGNSIGYVGQASIIYFKSDNLPKKIIVLLNNGSCTISDMPIETYNVTFVCK